MEETKKVIEKIVEGIQEKKGSKIVVVDMSQLENYVCQYFVICEGKSNTHVAAIADSIKDYVREQIRVKPFAVDGVINSQWIAMDYGEIIVHVFQPEYRQFYNLESLWADAVLTEIPDLD
ncbi:MAG: ribosome silencing factor [Paludibacteraceae bacterium]|nr:ribosome silencing factor [Paludibacteraceae bacterium]MBR4839728.1 ribosome silencing factor [Paludibacteraceae bacterium]